MTSLHLTDSIFVQISSKTIHFPPCPHLIFPVALQLFITLLSNCIVYSSHANSIVRGKKMPLYPTRFSYAGSKGRWSLRALNIQLSVFNFPKNENCQKAKYAGDVWLDTIVASVPADISCSLHVWEHSQRSWQHPPLPNGKSPTPIHRLSNCLS